MMDAYCANGHQCNKPLFSIPTQLLKVALKKCRSKPC